MRERSWAWSVLFAAILAGCSNGPVAAQGSGKTAAAQASGSPVVASCVNGRLPAELLDGEVAAPSSPLPVVTGVAPHAKLRLAVAADEQTRELGLMCVLRLRLHAGMIFVFPRSDDWEFWMKNTLAPLDMVWLEGDGTVTTVAADVPASTFETSDASVARRRGHGLYVIELRAGEAALDKLTAGTRIVLPALRADAQ